MIRRRRTPRFRRSSVCHRFVEVVTEYLDGAMSPAERARFEHHLADCDGCERYLAQIREVVRLTGRVTVADVDALGPDARDRLLGAFREYHRIT